MNGEGVGAHFVPVGDMPMLAATGCADFILVSNTFGETGKCYPTIAPVTRVATFPFSGGGIVLAARGLVNVGF